MKLEDLKKLFGEAIDKADFVVHSLSRLEKVDSVSLHLDSDGVMSLVFHVGHTQGRTDTAESRHLKNAIELYEYFDRTKAKDLEDSYIDWETLENALDSYGCPEDPDEYDTRKIPGRISALLKDRNALAEEIETLKKKLQTPKPKEEPKKSLKAEKPMPEPNKVTVMKVTVIENESNKTKPQALEPEEIDTARSVIFDNLSKEQPMSTTRIAKDSCIPAELVEVIMNHAWFKKVKGGWRIAVKERGS